MRWYAVSVLTIGLGLGGLLATVEHPGWAQISVVSDAPLQPTAIAQLARQTTVRILTGNAAGSGVIVRRQRQTYTVLTNWHVVEFGDRPVVVTADGQRYSVVSSLRQLGRVDLAIVQFRSPTLYAVAPISDRPTLPGQIVYAAGFPMYGSNFTSTIDQGINAFRLTQGTVSLWLPKPLNQGYQMGYTNAIAIGMSGGPVFDSQGQLVGINGRVKHREPAFGSYGFEDGSDPDPVLLDQISRSSWGIPIATYLHLTSD